MVASTSKSDQRAAQVATFILSTNVYQQNRQFFANYHHHLTLGIILSRELALLLEHFASIEELDEVVEMENRGLDAEFRLQNQPRPRAVSLT
jgi:hypothetical protein